MVRKNRKGSAANKYIDGMLDLIRERGGSHGVTLREVSKRLGYAHTNAYNYFTDLQDLMWATLRRALLIYAKAIVLGLEDDLPPREYLRRMLSNYAEFGIKHPGLYRLISSDPIVPEEIPGDIIGFVSELKSFMVAVVGAVGGDSITSTQAGEITDILISYLDGEALAFINGRILPGEDFSGRAAPNAMRIVQLMLADAHEGFDLETVDRPDSYPVLDVGELAGQLGVGWTSSQQAEGGAA